MWPFKSKARRDREALETLGTAMVEGLAAGIAEGERLIAAGEPAWTGFSPEAEAWLERVAGPYSMLACEPGSCEVCDERRT